MILRETLRISTHYLFLYFYHFCDEFRLLFKTFKTRGNFWMAVRTYLECLFESLSVIQVCFIVRFVFKIFQRFLPFIYQQGFTIKGEFLKFIQFIKERCYNSLKVSWFLLILPLIPRCMRIRLFLYMCRLLLESFHILIVGRSKALYDWPCTHRRIVLTKGSVIGKQMRNTDFHTILQPVDTLG